MIRAVAFILTTLLSTSLYAVPVVDTREPNQIIEETTTAAMEMLKQRRQEFVDNPELLHEVVNRDMLPLIDVEYSARLILGRAGRGISPEQLDNFASAMSDLLLMRYSQGLSRFHTDRTIEIYPMKGKNTEKLTRVRIRFQLRSGGFVPVDFAFRKTDLGWKVFDLTVEGISYVMTYRNQISPLVAQNGIDKVTEDIRKGTISLKH
jgi:phospholipid transport system substrate-binding protein